MHVQRTFSYNSLPSLRDQTWNFLISHFVKNVKNVNTRQRFSFSCSLGYSPLERNSRKNLEKMRKLSNRPKNWLWVQLHHYTTFNLACRTGAIFSRISALRACLSLVWKTQKKNVHWAGWIERGIAMKLKQRKFFGRFDNFLIFSTFVWILILDKKRKNKWVYLGWIQLYSD